jgi:hypothetical protein
MLPFRSMRLLCRLYRRVDAAMPAPAPEQFFEMARKSKAMAD